MNRFNQHHEDPDTTNNNGGDDADATATNGRPEPMPAGTLLSIRESALACGVSTDTIDRDLRKGRFPNAQQPIPGGAWKIPAGDLVTAGRLGAEAVASAAALIDTARDLGAKSAAAVRIAGLEAQVVGLQAQVDGFEARVADLHTEIAFLRGLLGTGGVA